MRYAWRGLRKAPAFAAAAIVTLALAIGASTAIFSVADAVLLRPLPYPDADRLALVFWDSPAGNARSFLYSNADFFDLRAGTSEIFDDMCGIASFRAFVSREDGSAEQVAKAMVSTNFLKMMGARIALGRNFEQDDSAPQPAPVLIPQGTAAILSYEYWQRRYGGSRDVLGKQIANGPRIVGVLAPGFKLFFPPAARIDSTPDFYIANNGGYDTAHRNLLLAGAIGRLKSDLTLARAQDRLNALRPALRKNSFDPQANLVLEPIARYFTDQMRPAIVALSGAVLFVLLIACANVANLLLVRAGLREREFAVRAALGGGWWRLIRQTLAEVALIAAAATLCGIALAWLGIRALLAIAPPDLPRLESVSIDLRVLAFSIAAGFIAAALSGMIPALRTGTPDLVRILRGARAALPSRPMLRNAAVMLEVALSFVLLAGCGLMLRSFIELRRIDPGYDPHGVLTLFITRDWPLTRQAGRIDLLREIQDRLRAVPGVENVSASLVLPLDWAIDRPKTAPSAANGSGADAEPDFQEVMPDYFETLRTPLLAGRTFTPEDNAPARALAIIDQRYAERVFSGNPIGRKIPLPGAESPTAEVIGVVAHQRLISLSDPGRETVYLLDGSGSWGIGVSRNWMVRTKGDPAKLAAPIRAEIAKIDPQLVISKIRPMGALVDHDQSATRFSLFLIALFAAIAVIQAGVGLYGVLATSVRQRTSEIGVRMALGAAPGGIFRLITAYGLRLSAIGIAIGVLAAAGVTRVMSAMLIGVRPLDPITFAGAIVLFVSIAALACWIPASRAASLEPMDALRDE